MTSMKLQWQSESAPPDLRPLLRILGEEYPIREAEDPGTSPDAVAVGFVCEPGLSGYSISRRDRQATVSYDQLACAGRAIGTLLSGLAAEGRMFEERAAFSTIGIVLDCGHNATVLPAHFKRWLRRLALQGYNTAMIYTEAGYLLPDEPCFGYMRGTY